MRMGSFEEHMSPEEWKLWKGERRMSFDYILLAEEQEETCIDCGDLAYAIDGFGDCYCMACLENHYPKETEQ